MINISKKFICSYIVIHVANNPRLMFILHKEIRWKEPAANAVKDDVDSPAVGPLVDGVLELLLPVVHLDHVKM